MLALLLRWYYEGVLAGSVAAVAASQVYGWPLEALALGWSLFVLALAALLERVAPFDAGWNRPQRDSATDAGSALVLVGLADPLLRALMPLAVAAWLEPSRSAAWPAALPFVLQVLLAVLWLELARYASHRAHHALRSLWWLHALHHGSRRLYWLNNLRFHPLNHAANTLVSVVPLLVAGTPQEVLLAALALTQPVLLLQHINVATRSGRTNFVLNTNELHRWHHSTEPAEANTNFGGALVIWDQLFGTYRNAPGAPAQVGLFAGSSGGYPAQAGYARQVLSMFGPACCRAA